MAAWAGEPVQALLFDPDGTLVDSMPLHHDAWRQWFAAQGLAFHDFPNLLCAVSDFEAFELDAACPRQAAALSAPP